MNNPDNYDSLIKEMVNKNRYLGDPYDNIVGLIGVENTIKIMDQFGGSQVSFPMKKNVVMPFMPEIINREFDGYHYAEFAKKYGISTSYIRKVYKKLD